MVREAEFVSPEALHLHYTRIVEGYVEGLRSAQVAGEVGDIDPEVAAWALMGIGEMVGMRYVLWERDADGRRPDQIDPHVLRPHDAVHRDRARPRVRHRAPTPEDPT